MDESAVVDEFACLTKPLPAEPSPWVRLPPTWRQRSFSGFGWFVLGAIVVGWLIPMRSGASAPDWFVWFCVVVAAAWIAATVPGGLVDRRRAKRLDAARERDPDKPWLWDYRWDPRGVSGSPLRRLLLASPRIGGFVVNGLIFNLLGLSVPPLVWWFWWSIVGLDVTWMAWRAWRIYGVGTAQVSFTKFPFHPGERVTLLFGMSEGGATFERVSFCLRRLEEAQVSPFWKWPGGKWPGAIWRHGVREHRPPGELPGGDQHIQLDFDVPATAHGTRLSARPPQYWALDVVANTSMGPYTESFLIPIYEKPAGPAA